MSPGLGKGHVVVSGPEEHLNLNRGGVPATTSLPSIRTMGILDKHWVPPTDAMQHVSLMSSSTNMGSLQQQSANLNHQYSQQQQQLLSRQDDGRIQSGWVQQQQLPVVNGRQTSAGMPVGLDWLNNE